MTVLSKYLASDVAAAAAIPCSLLRVGRQRRRHI